MSEVLGDLVLCLRDLPPKRRLLEEVSSSMLQCFIFTRFGLPVRGMLTGIIIRSMRVAVEWRRTMVVAAAPVTPDPVAVELMVVAIDIPLHLKYRLGGESLLGLGCGVILWRVFHDSGSADGPAVSLADSSSGDFFEPALNYINVVLAFHVPSSDWG